MITNPAIDNMRIIVDRLATSNIPVTTLDIKENLARPQIHVQQVKNMMQLMNRGTEVELTSSYLVTVFFDRKYVTSLNAQLMLMELLSNKIVGPDYTIYPTNLQFQLYPDDGVLECGFDTYNYHAIGAGTDESAVEKMQQLLYQENINERTEG